MTAVAEKPECKFEPEFRNEVCAILAALSADHDINWFQQKTDAELVACIRGLDRPFQYTGDTLERIARLLGLLQLATEGKSLRTRTEFEFAILQIDLHEVKGQRTLFGVVGLVLGVIFFLAAMAGAR